MKPRRRARSFLGRLVVGLVALGLGGLLVYGYLPKPIEVDVAVVGKAELRVTIDEEGKTRLHQRFTLSAPITGTASRITLRPGDAVAVGTVITTIEPPTPPLHDERASAELHAKVKAAEAAVADADAKVRHAGVALQAAQREQRRLKQIGKASTREEQEQAGFTVRLRRSELQSATHSRAVAAGNAEQARSALGEVEGGGSPETLQVKSPIRGQVLRVQRESEGPVSPGTALVDVGDLSLLEVVVDVLSADAVKIRPGMRVLLDRWGSEPELEGKVKSVEPGAFTETSPLGVAEQRVNVRVELVSKREEWPGLGDGYSVEAHVVLWEKDDVLQVPLSALFRQEQGWAALVVEEGRAAERQVRIGVRGTLQAEVLDGLAEGEEVIVHPAEGLKAGARVVPRSTSAPTAKGSVAAR